MFNVLYLDAETYYDDEYSLRKLTPPEYILDKRFEEIMWATAVNDGPQQAIPGPDFPKWLAQFDPANTATVCFNALFDNAILSYRHRWVPCQMFDTMNMARALRGHMLSRMSLEHVASALGVGEKGKTILKMKGLHREDMIRQGIWMEAMAYAMQDNKLSKGIFKLLMPEFPRQEWRLMDLVLRCAIEPKFHCDRQLLVKHIIKLREDKVNLLASTGVTKADLMSGPKFQAVLERYGVVVQYKVSPATGKNTPAFAKTDAFMAELQEHENPTVQALAAARLGLKSTLEETRAIRLLKIATLDWTPYCGSKLPLMPIPLRYGAAHTHRLAGDWSINMQNMTRGSPLRRALIAPPGHKVIVIDLAQIEARLVSWLAGATGLLEAFRTGDVYSFFATQVFGTPVNRKAKLPNGDPDPLQFAMGFIGKTGVLGLGFAAGVDKFYDMVLKLARLMKLDLSTVGFDYALAEKTVTSYRSKNPQIPALWKRADRALASVWAVRADMSAQIGPLTIRYGEIVGPGGLPMRYHNPRFDQDAQEYMYDYGGKPHRFYGAKSIENMIQYLARLVVMEAALRISAQGLRFCLQAHDELGFIVSEADIGTAREIIQKEMKRPPSWAPDLPLDAEIGPKQGGALSYGDAK